MLFDELAKTLIERQSLPPLCPQGIYDAALSSRIQNASDEELFGGAASTPTQAEMRSACRAGLLLMNDDLDASHEICQAIETPTGSAWHAILHRREGDFSNANYWWRRAGNHPAFDELVARVTSTLQSNNSDDTAQLARELERENQWLPMRFVAACESAARRNASTQALQEIQMLEMKMLLNWCRARI